VSADRTHQLDIPGTADAGHLRAERPGDLHGERAHASRGAIDENRLSSLEASMVAKSLQGRERRDRDAGRLLERWRLSSRGTSGCANLTSTGLLRIPMSQDVRPSTA
jgi:hypothetical protein